ncbi:MAG: hypothetical protein KJ646_05720, partial [Nanoarchaeota archaeon]|nr:hypothetical protein [Nanoarchaeota archaeon]MBU4116317.1 hypothetical protein [Nanoarchaeota archaeon]
NSYSNATVFSAILESGNTTKTENWTCGLRVYDGDEYSDWVNSSKLEIRDNPSAYKFAVKNSSGDNVASIDDVGNMFLKESVYESQGSLSPGDNSFIIRDSSSANVAYFNSAGSLFLLGIVSESAAMSPVGYNLELRNSTGSLVAYFDDEGNLKLKGVSYENYASP